jgi:hypothetical protein
MEEIGLFSVSFGPGLHRELKGKWLSTQTVKIFIFE